MRKCLVVDLDNTLWRGVIGEEAIEPHDELQDQLLDLKGRGVILAIASKNNETDAVEGFRHPGMRLSLSDFATAAIGWQDKPSSLRRIARTLNIGLDAVAFLDDNPAERELVTRTLPEVAVLDRLDGYDGFQDAAVTDEDRNRTTHYQALVAASELRDSSTDMDAFLRDLRMETTIAQFDEGRLPRISQLVGKTNQFNLTTRRHGAERLREFMYHDATITAYLEHADRFTNHGLVGVGIATTAGDVAEIDTLLLSCRVIGRGLEHQLLEALRAAAVRKECRTILGVYIPTARNAVCRDFYKDAGFHQAYAGTHTSLWEAPCRP